MKNIRILEDGNRLIVVLEGYEKSAVSALMEMLGTTASPLSHIKPHTGEAQFRLKGTEKEIPLGNAEQAQKPEMAIKKPAFVEQLEAEAQARKQASGIKKPAQGTTPEPAQPVEPAQPTKTAQTAPKRQEAAQAVQEGSMPVPDDGPGKGMDGSVCTDTSPAKTQAHTADTGVRAQQKPAEFMNSFELRAYIEQADSGKLSALLRRKGRFPNTMNLLNADDRTIREYVKELLLTA